MIKNIDPHHQGITYNWEGVMEFLYNQYQNNAQKENIWALQRDSLKQHIKDLEGKLIAIQNINRDLKNRNSMLEYSLRQFKSSQSHKHQKQNDQDGDLPKMPQRRPKPNKIHLTKILCSLGIPNLLQDIKKDLQNKPLQGGLHLDLNKLQSQLHNSRQHANQRLFQDPQIKFQQLKPCLNGHQDGVRDVCFLNKASSTQLISVSQDCTMKIWNVNKKQNRVVNLQCKGTIRQHAGPIFTCTQGDGFVFTAGMEGVIRVYDFNKENSSTSNKSLSLKFKHNENQKLEPIWQLVYDKPRRLLIATSSQMEIRGYKCNEKDGKVSLNLSNKFLFKNPKEIKQDQDEFIPTAVCLKNDSLFASYFNSDCIVQYDLDSNKMITQINSQMQETLSANRLIAHPRCLIGAYEDFKVRLFDQNKLVKAFKAHDGPVMSASMTSNSNYFFTCGHDGYVKLWDLRKCETINSFLAHQKKHDQSIHCVSTNFDNLTVSGGADSIIKVFHQIV